ncbi:hypothetical protein [Beijerinckia mobilis]|uniref:hypothetical protein n=1 Tax=Beijerinckia mobilis TaxID=231434 RepID=UPI0012EC7C13|nr:hypothetical protein [Beijerinckia mobilis]
MAGFDDHCLIPGGTVDLFVGGGAERTLIETGAFSKILDRVVVSANRKSPVCFGDVGFFSE